MVNPDGQVRKIQPKLMKRPTINHWVNSQRNSSLQDVIMKLTRIKQRAEQKHQDPLTIAKKTSDVSFKRESTPAAPRYEPAKKVQAAPPALKKDRFFKEHDKNEEYSVVIELRSLKVSAHCPLLSKYDQVLVKMDRGSTKRT